MIINITWSVVCLLDIFNPYLNIRQMMSNQVLFWDQVLSKCLVFKWICKSTTKLLDLIKSSLASHPSLSLTCLMRIIIFVFYLLDLLEFDWSYCKIFCAVNTYTIPWNLILIISGNSQKCKIKCQINFIQHRFHYIDVPVVLIKCHGQNLASNIL